MQNKLIEITEKLINSATQSSLRQRYILIRKMLNEDDLFFKININTAYNILKDLGFNKEESLNIYQELINSKNK